MPPCFTPDDKSNAHTSYPKQTSYLLLTGSRLNQGTYLCNVIRCQLGKTVLLSPRPSAVQSHVRMIRLGRVPPQVGKHVVRTITVIVARLHTGWPRSDEGFQNQPVNRFQSGRGRAVPQSNGKIPAVPNRLHSPPSNKSSEGSPTAKDLSRHVHGVAWMPGNEASPHWGSNTS